MAWRIQSWFGRQGRHIQQGVCLIAVTAASIGTTFIATADGPPAGDARKKVTQQLAFGEFAAAIETARAVANPGEKANLLGMIANAQLNAGDASAARGTTRRMEQPQAAG